MPRVTSELLKKLKNDNDNKVNGKVAPDTNIEKAVKNYEAALAAAQKKTSADTLTKMYAAMKAVEAAIASSQPALKAKGFGDFGLRMEDRMAAALRDEDVVYKKMFADHAADQKIAAAPTQDEKVYVAMQDVFGRKHVTMASAPSLALFVELNALLAKLYTQAETCKGIDAFHAKKYTAQQQILAAAKKEVAAKEGAYKAALKKGIDDRKAVAPVLASLKVKLVKATADIAAKEKLIATGIKLKDFAGVSKLKAEVAKIAEGAIAAYNQESSIYAPGAPLRQSSDLVAAKIAQEDSAAHVAHITTPLFTAYKDNSDLKRAIEAKAKEIEAIAPPVPPRSTKPQLK